MLGALPKSTLTGKTYFILILALGAGSATICLNRLSSLARNRNTTPKEFIKSEQNGFLLGLPTQPARKFCAEGFSLFEKFRKHIIDPLADLEDFFDDVVRQKQRTATFYQDANKFFRGFRDLLAGLAKFGPADRPLLTRFDPAAFEALATNYENKLPEDFRTLFVTVFRNQASADESRRAEAEFAAADESLKELLFYQRVTGIYSERSGGGFGVTVPESSLELKISASRNLFATPPPGQAGEFGLGDAKRSSLTREPPSAWIGTVHGAWAASLRQLLLCGNISLIDFRLMAVIVFKMFFFGILEPSQATGFFEQLFQPVLEQPLPADHPLVAFLLLHGKLAGRAQAWQDTLAALRSGFAPAASNPSGRHFAAQRTREVSFTALIIEFSGRYESLVEATWALFNVQLAGNFSGKPFGKFRFEVSRAFERYVVRGFRLVLRAVYANMRVQVTDVVDQVVAIADASRLDKVSEGVLEVSRVFGMAEAAAADVVHSLANYKLLKAVGAKLREFDAAFEAKALLKFLERLNLNDHLPAFKTAKECPDFYHELDSGELFLPLVAPPRIGLI